MTEDFETLYRSHYRRVFGLCLRLLGQRAQAEEAAQETFVRAYRAFDRYDPRQPFSAWVLRIASNYCVDLVRRGRREAGLFDDSADTAEDAPDAAPTALAALLDAERAGAVREAVAALPDKYRLPLVLAYYEDADYAEIARRLGLTRNHVGVLLLRARRALRAALTRTIPERQT